MIVVTCASPNVDGPPLTPFAKDLSCKRFSFRCHFRPKCEQNTELLSFSMAICTSQVNSSHWCRRRSTQFPIGIMLLNCDHSGKWMSADISRFLCFSCVVRTKICDAENVSFPLKRKRDVHIHSCIRSLAHLP